MKSKKKSVVALSLAVAGSLMVAGIAAAAYATNFNSFPTLQQGASGGYVRALQANLYAFGQAATVGTIDGSFGSSTKTAVQNFQTAYGLTSDGSMGPASWSKMSAYTVAETTSTFWLDTPSSTTYYVDYNNPTTSSLVGKLKYKSDNTIVNSFTVY
ncbi:putative peptidoglycan binding protein [Paenibacillus taihuensis]|uniref:Putative peptidoglycan binding protein n=1 Tax=Paenibacillus taihuensis TaxID=1156355 RepID=A0A3D9RMX9_9BACL|nr:peptidoglycan-binding domain-containing protein [Paenibacillus taihuensis]REE81240.1 putative peptidoglycan binding protein [Paenibacillus taihuensis]